MKLPISLLVLTALSQALSVPVTKRSEVKTLENKTAEAKITEAMPAVAKNSAAWGKVADQMDNNQTSKRELFEGNFGERTKPIVSKFELKTPPGKSMLARELHETFSEQTPAHQMFDRLLPQIDKISDVLSGHGPSFEEAVARHLHSPVSVYQTILSLPTTYEAPTRAASQSGYSNPKSDLLRNAGRDKNEQKLPPKFMKILNAAEQADSPLPRYTVNQPRLHFDVHPQPLDSGLAQQHENLSKEVRPQEVPRKSTPLLYPLYDQLGPFRYPGQLLPSQYSHRQGIFQIVSVDRDFDNSKDRNTDKDYPSEENSNAKVVTPKLQIEMPLLKQGYHAHPNGAISFARFTHNLRGSKQHDTAPQPQSETFHQPQPAQYQSQAIPIQLPQRIPPELMLQSQQQNVAAVKQKLPHPSSLQELIQEIEKYQPLYQQQHQPRTLNALQQHLLVQEPRQSSNLLTIQRQRVPAFMPLPQSLPTPEFYLIKGNRPPIITGQTPRPFSYSDQSENYDLSLGQTSVQLNSLPPLKPNYSKNVKPLEPNNAPIFLPTLPTSTAKVEPVSDQLISSTTIQPDVKGQENPKTQSIQEETELQSKTPQPLQPEVFHPSQQTVQPASVQSTTYLPFVTKEPQSIFFQYSTPQPISLRPYQSTSQSPYQSTSQSPYQPTSRPTLRHDVVIQQQEIQEIFFEPSRQLSFIPRHQNKPELVLSPKDEMLQLRAQHPPYQLFEQLLPYKQEYQDIHSPQQYIVAARESQQKPVSTQRGKPQQYLIEQSSFPIPHIQPLQQFQQQLLQSQQPEPEQFHQQQQGLNKAQQKESDQAHQQQKQLEALEKAHQQQKQAQQQESEQAQQLIQESEQALQQQYQQKSLEPSNQIQISTLKPPQDIEKQTETVEIQQQTEAQTELQQDSKLQSSTGKPDEPPKHLSEPTLHLQQPYLGPFLSPSVVPQLYASQQLVAQPYHNPLLDVPPHSHVQYLIG